MRHQFVECLFFQSQNDWRTRNMSLSVSLSMITCLYSSLAECEFKPFWLVWNIFGSQKIFFSCWLKCGVRYAKSVQVFNNSLRRIKHYKESHHKASYYYSYKSWSIFKTKDSFVIYSSWAFQNCPWKLNLTKICKSNWAKQKTKLSFHQPFLKANIALYLSSLGQFLVVPGLPYISTSIMWGNGSMCTMIWDIFCFCLHPNSLGVSRIV